MKKHFTNVRRNGIRLLGAAGDIARAAELSGELAVAATRTIGYRTALMAEAVGNPVALTNPEFTLMGREKVEAALESGQALAESVRTLQDAWMTWLTAQTTAFSRAGMEMLTCRTPMDMLKVQQHFMETSISGTMGAMTRMTRSVARMAGAGLAPVHRTASANARRLAERRG